MLTLHKILPTLILPVGLTLLLLVAAFSLRRWPIVMMTAGFLWLASLPCVSGFLLSELEGETREMSIREAPSADAILVLSGMLGPDRGSGKKNNWGEGYDRFDAGIQLWQAGKAPLLVLTDPALSQSGQHETEGKRLQREAWKLGLPEDCVLLLGPVGNTADEATLFSRLARKRGWSGFILVTSAWHLPRALERFDKAGVKAIPFPVDFRTPTIRKVAPVDFFPTGHALAKTELFLREWMGRLYYRILD